MQFIIELPESISLKEKRRVIKSIKDKLYHKFKLSIAEVDLHDSLQFSQLGAALVSNSKVHGEKILNKTINFIEENIAGRIVDIKIKSETF